MSYRGRKQGNYGAGARKAWATRNKQGWHRKTIQEKKLELLSLAKEQLTGGQLHRAEKALTKRYRSKAEERYIVKKIGVFLKEGKPKGCEIKDESVGHKKPWEMVYKEFFDIAGAEYTAGDRFGIVTRNNVPVHLSEVEGVLKWVGERGATPEERIHRAVIRQAIRDGEKVPEEVLKEYSDLREEKPLGAKRMKLELLADGLKNKIGRRV